MRQVGQYDLLLDAFARDEWRMRDGAGDGFWLSQPQAADKRATRPRLHNLTPLTSHRLRIQFEIHPSAIAGAPSG